MITKFSLAHAQRPQYLGFSSARPPIPRIVVCLPQYHNRLSAGTASWKVEDVSRGVIVADKLHCIFHFSGICHPMLTTATNPNPVCLSQAQSGAQVQMLTAHPALAYLHDHVVQGSVILPAAAFLELCLAAGHALLPKQQLAVRNATIMSPLPLTAASSTITCSISSIDGSCRVATSTTHFAASLSAVSNSELHSSQMGSRHSALALLMAQAGLLEPSGHAADAVKHPSAVAAVATAVVDDISSYWVHPAALDSCLQLGAAVPEDSSAHLQGSNFVPVAAAAFYTPEKQSLGQQLYTAASLGTAPSNSSEAVTVRDHAMVNGNSSISGWLQGLQARAVKKTTTGSEDASASDSMYEIALLTETPVSTPMGLQGGAQEGTPLRLKKGLVGVAHALQAMQLAAAAGLQQITLQTPSMQMLHAGTRTDYFSNSAALTAAASRGLLQAFSQEHPTISTAAVQGSATYTASHTLTLSTSSVKSETAVNAFGVSISSNTVQKPRLVSSSTPAMREPYQLRPQPRGAISSLLPLPYTQHKPAPGMVELAVHAVGVNFRDVLNVLGMYPGDPGEPGSDCAGKQHFVPILSKDVQTNYTLHYLSPIGSG